MPEVIYAWLPARRPPSRTFEQRRADKAEKKAEKRTKATGVDIYAGTTTNRVFGEIGAIRLVVPHGARAKDDQGDPTTRATDDHPATGRTIGTIASDCIDSYGPRSAQKQAADDEK